MAFFEYDMASYFLRHPPVHAAATAPASSPAPSPSAPNARVHGR
jgi:hypothetical protein